MELDTTGLVILCILKEIWHSGTIKACDNLKDTGCHVVLLVGISAEPCRTKRLES